MIGNWDGIECIDVYIPYISEGYETFYPMISVCPESEVTLTVPIYSSFPTSFQFTNSNYAVQTSGNITYDDEWGEITGDGTITITRA